MGMEVSEIKLKCDNSKCNYRIIRNADIRPVVKGGIVYVVEPPEGWVALKGKLYCPMCVAKGIIDGD